MKIATVGIDLSKSSFYVHGVDDAGTTIVSRMLRRNQVNAFFADLPPCLVGMESCASSNYWARELAALGHTVRLVPTAYVKPYVKRDKNDRKDAEAICEAVTKPAMTFVPVKTEEQQGILMLHRSRNLLAHQTVMIRNTMRGCLAEFGLTATVGKAHLRTLISRAGAGADLPRFAKKALSNLLDIWRRQEAEIAKIDKLLIAWHKRNAASTRLATIPGIGVVTATAVVSTVGDFSRFRSGRHFASWLGLAPREHSTGGKVSLGRISKRGDSYLRKLLFLCAVAVLVRARRNTDALSQWVGQVITRKPTKLACVAIANKLARIIWAISVRQQSYLPAPLPSAGQTV